MGELDRVAAREHESMLERRAQLADISGERVGDDGVPCGGSDTRR
jgi:hypothetical protein